MSVQHTGERRPTSQSTAPPQRSTEFVVSEISEIAAGQVRVPAPRAPAAEPEPWVTAAADRMRLAREVHDWVGNGVTLALRQLDLHAIDVAQGRESESRRVNDVRRTLEELLQQTRRLVADLRDVPAVPALESALREFVGLVAVDTTEVSIAVHGDESVLPAEVRDEVFLIVREALRNAIAHARADHVSATLRFDGDRFTAVVEDDGVGPQGFPNRRGRRAGAGLATMRERAVQMGGMLRIVGAPWRGTRVELELDIREEWWADAC